MKKRSPKRPSPPSRPNFLFIHSDDHCAYVLGADGNPKAETPNLDHLASQGLYFTRHFCNSPVCTPSRQSFFTGQMPHSAGVTLLNSSLSEDKPTLAKQLKKAGYLTAVFGKMHFNRPRRPGLHGFDVCESDLNMYSAEELSRRPFPDIKTQPPWRPFRDPAEIWLNAAGLPYPARDEDMPNTRVARMAVNFLEEHKADRFALWAGFNQPHSPFFFPIEYRDRFRPEQFELPRMGDNDAAQVPLILRHLDPARQKGIIAAYYTAVAFLDKNIGLVLSKLEELGLEQDTLVIYLPDHGYLLGQHGRFEKHCCYDEAVRVPLIFRFPGRIRSGTVAELTESVDVPATVLDLLGVEPLPIQHGVSLRPLLESPQAKGRDFIFSEYLENEEACLRTSRWKFIYCTGRRARQDGFLTDNPTPGRYARLFDLEADPAEFDDVAADHPDVVSELKNLMLGRIRETHPDVALEPPGLSTEDALDWYLRPRDAAGSPGETISPQPLPQQDPGAAGE